MIRIGITGSLASGKSTVAKNNFKRKYQYLVLIKLLRICIKEKVFQRD